MASEDHPLVYVSGGLLGDFIHQLSVVQEQFLATGRRGRVYLRDGRGHLSDHGDAFGLGLKRAYDDLKRIVLSQDYVESFQLHAGEPFDVNLSAWRQSALLYTTNWSRIFEDVFHVPWGAHKWLTLPEASEYADTVLISLTAHRAPTVDWGFLRRLPGPALFVTDNRGELDHWRAVTRSDLPTKVFHSLYELYRAIHSCRLFIGNLSSPLTVALAAHRPCIGLRCHSIDDVHVTGLTPQLPHFQLADQEPTGEMLISALGAST